MGSILSAIFYDRFGSRYVGTKWANLRILTVYYTILVVLVLCVKIRTANSLKCLIFIIIVWCLRD